jgi:hypothetical protein
VELIVAAERKSWCKKNVCISEDTFHDLKLFNYTRVIMKPGLAYFVSDSLKEALKSEFIDVK